VKAATVLGQVWGIGKRRFGRRGWLFDALIWTVMSYGDGRREKGQKDYRRGI